MLTRIPISLKVYDEDKDFYEMVMEKRKNRELSSLIDNLLKAYSSNKIVKKEVDSFIECQNPYIKIQEELMRMAVENSRQSTMAQMMGDYTSNAMEKAYKDEEESETKQPEVKPKQESASSRAEDLEKINMLEKQVALLTEQVFGKGLGAKQPDDLPENAVIIDVKPKEVVQPIFVQKNQVIKEKIEPVFVQTQEEVVQPIIPQEKPVIIPEVEQPKQVIIPDIEKPTITLETQDGMNQPKIQAETIKKPASFGKLLKSM